MSSKVSESVGKTQDTGYQFGIRKTFACSVEKLWVFLFSPAGLSQWLGNLPAGFPEAKASFQTQEGVQGKVRVRKEVAHVRLDWQPVGRDRPVLLQVRCIPKGEKTTVSFHLERLHDAAERAEMQKHWEAVVEELSKSVVNL